jgi:predicted nucleotidyltransferase
MLKKLKSLSEIKRELREYLESKEVYDVVIFGSYVKGKENPSDIDVAVISDKDLKEIDGYHVSFLRPEDFFEKIPSLVTTLFKEGHSLKSGKSFSESYGFKNKCLFSYWLSDLSDSEKVKTVNFLRGCGKEKGAVEEQGGEWLANGIFICSIDKDYLFENFFMNRKIKFRKDYLLMH